MKDQMHDALAATKKEGGSTKGVHVYVVPNPALRPKEVDA